jgi:hypothetical protein
MHFQDRHGVSYPYKDKTNRLPCHICDTVFDDSGYGRTVSEYVRQNRLTYRIHLMYWKQWRDWTERDFQQFQKPYQLYVFFAFDMLPS